MTQTIEIPIPEELLKRLDDRARTAGLERSAYIRAVLSREVAAEPSLDEILAPFRSQVDAARLSDEELDRLFADSREERYGERNR